MSRMRAVVEEAVQEAIPEAVPGGGMINVTALTVTGEGTDEPVSVKRTGTLYDLKDAIYEARGRSNPTPDGMRLLRMEQGHTDGSMPDVGRPYEEGHQTLEGLGIADGATVYLTTQDEEEGRARRLEHERENARLTVIREKHRQEHAREVNEEKQHHEENKQFAKHESFGSRAVGGVRPNDEVLYGKAESTDYLVPDTPQEESFQRTFTPIMRTRRRLYIWGLYMCLGVAVAAEIVIILHLCDLILKVRVKATNAQLEKEEMLLAWLVWTGSSLFLCMIACVLVLWQPAAASSGIPGLIAFLNGVTPVGGTSPLTQKKTGFLSFQTLVAKSVGMTLSIPSGLCLGPEGPIIHIGALLAHHTTDFFQALSHKLLPERFHFSVQSGEGRDFLATGAAVGICVAFRAPLAGCLFVVEEAASFFTTEHLEYTFFATVIAYMVALALAQPEDGFTKFKQATGYFCTLYDWFDMLLFVVVAASGGVLGALFNHIVEELNHWRGHHVNKHIWKRVLEVVVLVLVTGTVSIFLPYFWDCETPTRSMLMEDSIGCLSEEDARQISQGAVSHAALTDLLSNCSSDATASKVTERLSRFRTPTDVWDAEGHEWKDFVWLDNANEDQPIYLHYQHSYTCPNKGDYNGMSMLWLNGGVKGVKVLLQRGFPHMLSWHVLVVFCSVYFIFAAYTSGVAVPAGLIVPHLLIGGSYGRAFGLLGIYQKKAMCSALTQLEEQAAAGELNLHNGDLYGGSDYMFDDTYFWSTVYRWIGRDCHLPDPGMYAVVGCASFLSGSGRITMMLATVIIELTDDASLIGPVGVASIIAMIVGNLFNHGLYHGLIPVMNMPFLNEQPADVMNLVHVSDLMTRDVICLSKVAKADVVLDIIEKYDQGEISHNAFPIVDNYDPERPDTMTGKKLRGIISLQNLRLAANCEKTMSLDTNKRRSRFLSGTELGVTFRSIKTAKMVAAGVMDEAVDARLVSDSLRAKVLTWLEKVPMLHEIAEPVLEKMLERMQVGSIDKHVELMHVGEPGNAMYFLENGATEALVRGKSVKTYAEGEFFGELALIADEPRKATVRACEEGATVWKLDKNVFRETLNMDAHQIKLMNFADRSPITVPPHAKVARAFGIFRKLGMRHLCVVDDDYKVVGILTRKDLMAYKIAESLIPPRVEALIRGFLYNWRKKRSTAPATPTKPRHKSSDETSLIVSGKIGARLGAAAAEAKHGVRDRSRSHDSDLAAENNRLKMEIKLLQQQLAKREQPEAQAVEATDENLQKQQLAEAKTRVANVPESGP